MDREGFYNEVYAVVAAIPAGRVLTYGMVARLTGFPNRSRMVGRALSEAADGLGLPCHRVVASGGRTAPYWPQQRVLLEAEGVAFRANGHVDMEKHLWTVI